MPYCIWKWGYSGKRYLTDESGCGGQFSANKEKALTFETFGEAQKHVRNERDFIEEV